jgi:hypothetical protein
MGSGAAVEKGRRLMKPIYCPACVARMKKQQLYQWIDDDETTDGPSVYYYCSCGLRGPVRAGVSFRGAAIKAGRAMRGIVDAVDVRIAKHENAADVAGSLRGYRRCARVVWMMLREHKLTRRQITERMRQEAAL